MMQRIRVVLSMTACRAIFLVHVLLTFSGLPLKAQEIHIRVLNGHNGKPIVNECLNLWLDRWRGGGLLVPTNRDGLIVLHFGNTEVVADSTSPNACKGLAVMGPKSLPKGADKLFVAGDNYVVCQEYALVNPGGPLADNLPANRMPSYSIRKILESGVTASNTCGKFKAEAKPGELIIFEKPKSFWQRMRE